MIGEIMECNNIKEDKFKDECGVLEYLLVKKRK